MRGALTSLALLPLSLLTCFGILGAGATAQTPAASPAGTRSTVMRVSEIAGIRRTEYPVHARVPFAKSALKDAARIRLRAGTAALASQGAAEEKWDDGSVKWLALDFNLSIGPTETREIQIEYGDGVTLDSAPPRGGLAITESADAIQVGSLKFTRAGSPLLLSAHYRYEYIGQGANGLVLVDASGKCFDWTGGSPALEILKPGPLHVVLRYSGSVRLSDTYAVPVTLTLDMPNSKSWVKATASVTDKERRVREILFETPFAFGAQPWLWDFGTDSGTYGVLRAPADMVVFQQLIDPKGGNAWTIETGQQGALRGYEMSASGRARTTAGWGHFQGPQAAVAFAIEDFSRVPGTHMVSFDGKGQATFRFVPADPAASHSLSVYQHYVPTPVAIGAATNPSSMLNPLVVVLDRDHVQQSGVR